MSEGEKDAYGWPSNHSRSLLLPKIYAACVLPGHWTTMLVKNYLWSLTPWTLMARYLHTYASSLSCGGFIAIKVQSTLPKVFGTLKISPEKLCLTANVVVGVLGTWCNHLRAETEFLKFSELSWMQMVNFESTDISNDLLEHSRSLNLQMNKIILNNMENWIMLNSIS